MKIKLILNDREYLEAFKDVALRTDDDIYIEIGNNDGILNEKMIVITDYAPEDINTVDYQNIVFLSTNPEDGLQNYKTGTPLRLFKYSSLSSILADIHQINYLLSASNRKSYDVLSDIYTIATDSFGMLSSDITKTIARQLLFHNCEKILIITLKAVNEYSNSDENDRSRFIRLRYYQETNRSYSIEHFVYKDNYGISYLRLPNGLNPIAFMSADDVSSFIRKLSDDGFDTILLDMGNDLSRRNLEIAEKSDRIIFYSENREIPVLDDFQFDKNGMEKLDILNLNRSDDCVELKIDNYLESLFKSYRTDYEDEKSIHN